MLKKSYATNGNTSGYALNTGETATVMAQHIIRSGKETEFEEAEV